jgi:hypothetical protein
MTKTKTNHKIPMIGKKFNFLTCVEELPRKKSEGGTKYLFKCDCGETHEAAGLSVRRGTTTGCKKCLSERRSANKNSNWKGFEGISSSKWSHISTEAKRRNINFEITIEYVWELFLKQNKKCSLSGIELKFDSKFGTFDGTASLDRINSSIGYVNGNVQWVHKDVNFMKQKFSQEYFIELCGKISNWNTSKTVFPKLPEKVEPNANNRHHGWKGAGLISASFWGNITYRCKDERKILQLTMLGAWRLFCWQGGRCALTGIELKFESGYHKKDGNASFDRVNSSKGYVYGNVQWVHKDVNLMKQSFEENYFITLCHKIFNFNKQC